jgi:hypothetical protein
MGMVEEVGTFLDGGSTRWALGTSLYLNNLPDEPNRAAAIYETGGFPPQQTFGNDLPAWENARIQLVCRSTSSATARADAGAAWTILQRVTNEALSSVSYLRIAPVQSPFLLRRDERGRAYFACNYDVTRRTTA